jgi:hypothetical protein
MTLCALVSGAPYRHDPVILRATGLHDFLDAK